MASQDTFVSVDDSTDTQNPPIEDNEEHSEPLLGTRGSAREQPLQSLRMNIILGTAPLVQIGVWGIVLTIWYNVIFRADWIFFSFHPLFNSMAFLFVTNAILLLQPTHTPEQKRIGAVTHGVLNGVALASFTTAFIIIVYNKISHGADHFTTAHGKIGFITYILLVIQTSVGVAMFYVPQIFGSVAKGKAVWKYHRASGYVSTWFIGVWDNIWVWVFLAVVAFLGLVSRIRLSKMKLF